MGKNTVLYKYKVIISYLNKFEEVIKMKNKKNQDPTLAKLVLITVAIELITKIIELIVAIIKLVVGN